MTVEAIIVAAYILYVAGGTAIGLAGCAVYDFSCRWARWHR